MIKQLLAVMALAALLGCSTADDTERWPAGGGRPTINVDGVEMPIERPVQP